LYSAICAYADRTKAAPKKVEAALKEIEFNIFETFAALLEWIASEYPKRPLLDNIFDEFTYFHVRKRLLMALFSVAALEPTLALSDVARNFLWGIICRPRSELFLIGEFIVAACLAIFWAQSNIQGSNMPDRELAALMTNIVNMNSNSNIRFQAHSPYCGAEDVVQWAYQEFLAVGIHDIADDRYYRRSIFLRDCSIY
jgi:hypothetical protein